MKTQVAPKMIEFYLDLALRWGQPLFIDARRADPKIDLIWETGVSLFWVL